MDFRRINKCFLTIILSTAFVAAFANRIINFNLYNVNGSVDVRFSISKGVPCNGYRIWHSVDSLNFFQVFEDPGICGSPTEEVSRNFLHGGISAGITHYYKVELIGTETSPIKRIYLELPNQLQLRVYPNPLIDLINPLTIQIISSSGATGNAPLSKVLGYIYNSNGSPVQSLELILSNGLTTISLNDLKDGLYIIWLTDNERIYRSKFFVQRKN